MGMLWWMYIKYKLIGCLRILKSKRFYLITTNDKFHYTTSIYRNATKTDLHKMIEELKIDLKHYDWK